MYTKLLRAALGGKIALATRMTTVEKRVLSDGSLHVAVRGEIGDRFDAAVQASAECKKVVVHLGDVKGLTSVGVRNFEEFIAGFGKREVVLIHISPAIAAQLIMIPDLVRGARVESAKLPFICPLCDRQLLHSVPWVARAHTQHAPKCACGAVMELDGMAEQYLPSG